MWGFTDSGSESYVDNLQIDRKDFDFQAVNQKETLIERQRKEMPDKKLGWLTDEQEDIDRFIFGDCTRKQKENQVKKQARQARHKQREAKRQAERLKKSRCSQKSERKSRKGSVASVVSKKPFDEKSMGRASNTASVCWIREDEFDDGIPWSDDDREKPKVPHEQYFSIASVSQVQDQRLPNYTKRAGKAPSSLQGSVKQPSLAFSLKSSLHSHPSSVKAKHSLCKQPSIQLFSEFQELSQEDDHQWFAEVKQEMPTVEEQERYREEQMQERKQYEEYKRRLYRKKKMAETRKSFERHQIEQLRTRFEQLHNKQELASENPRKKRPLLGLQKPVMLELAAHYGSSPATMNNLYREWRFDPTFSKQLARFDRIFTIGIGSQPAKPVMARERTQKRIETLTKLLQENPFLTQEQMCAALEESEQYKEKIERVALIRVLQLGNFQRKRLKTQEGDRNSPDALAQRSSFALHLRNYLARGFQVYFYDEMLVNENYDCETGWARGEREIIFHPESLITQSIVILGLLSGTGELLWDARFGDYSPIQLEEAIRGFMGAVEKKGRPGNRLLAISALRYRDVKAMGGWFQRQGWEVLFLPPHAMQLNPFFSFFEDLLKRLRQRKTRNFEALFQQVINYLRESEENCLGGEYLRKLEGSLKRAEHQEHF